MPDLNGKPVVDKLVDKREQLLLVALLAELYPPLASDAGELSGADEANGLEDYDEPYERRF